METIQAFWYDGRKLSLDNYEAFVYLVIDNTTSPEYRSWAKRARKLGYKVPTSRGCWYFNDFTRSWEAMDGDEFWNLINLRRAKLSKVERERVWGSWFV